MTHQPHPTLLREVVQALAEQGFDGMAHAMEALLNECMKIERQQALGVAPYERTPLNGSLARSPATGTWTTSLRLLRQTIRSANVYESHCRFSLNF